MAIALRGTAGNSATSTDLTVVLPVGTAQDDLVIAAYTINTAASGDLNMATVTAGYTEIADLFADDDRNANLGIYRKLQGSTTDTTVVFDDVTQETSGAVTVLIGTDTTTPLDAAATATTGIDSGTPDPPSITTVTANAWVIAIGGTTQEEGTIAVPTNYSNLITGVGENSATMMATRQVAVPGVENPGPFGGITANTTMSWAAATLAIRPAPSGGFIFKSNPYQSLLVR